MSRKRTSLRSLITVSVFLNLLTSFPTYAYSGNISTINSYNAAIDSYNLLLEARKLCENTFTEVNASRRILSATNTKRFCAYLDRDIEKVFREVTKRETLLDSYDNSTLMQVRDFMLLVQNYFEGATYSLDSSTVLGEEMLTLSAQLSTLDIFYEEVLKSENSIDSILDALPKTIASKISKEKKVIQFRRLAQSVEDNYSNLAASIEAFGKTSEPNVANYNNLVIAIQVFLQKVPQVQEINFLIQAVLKNIPSSYCLKGNLAQTLSTSNCPKGFRKVAINPPVVLKISEYALEDLSEILDFTITKPKFLEKASLFQNVGQARVVETSSEVVFYFVPPKIPTASQGKVSLEVGLIIGDPWKKTGNGRSVNTEVFDPFIEIFKSFKISETDNSVKIPYGELSQWAKSNLGIALDGQILGLTTRVRSGDALSNWSFAMVSPWKGIICLYKFSTVKPPLMCSN